MEWLAELFETNRIIVLSVYGQVFFVMGLAVALQGRQRSQLPLARPLAWLAGFGLLPEPGRRLLDEAPWVGECSLFDACVRVVERQVPHMERLSRTTAAGVTWMQARLAPFEGGLTLFLEDFTQRASAEVSLRQNRDLLHAVIEGTTDAVYEAAAAAQAQSKVTACRANRPRWGAVSRWYP